MKAHVQQVEPDQRAGNMWKCIAEKLPNSHLKVILDAGHFWILDKGKEILKTLIPEK